MDIHEELVSPSMLRERPIRLSWGQKIYFINKFIGRQINPNYVFWTTITTEW